MKSERSIFDWLVVPVILYSIITLGLEYEFADAGWDVRFFTWSERVVAVFFTAEYIARWIASRKLLYPLQWMAVIDLLAVLPFYFGGLVDLRALRVVRVVLVLKLYRYTSALESLRSAFHRVRYEIGVLGFALFTLASVSSVIIYELERDAQPQAFARLSDAAWYTLATLTTVGYGDKVPVTAGGKLAAVGLMIFGLGLFGTFMSLIGGAFLEEVRATVRRNSVTTAELSGELNPAEVLRAIEAGTYRGRDEELEWLLVRACRQLEDRQTRSPGPSTASPLG